MVGNSSTNTWMPTAVLTNKRNAPNSSNAPTPSENQLRGTSMATACKSILNVIPNAVTQFTSNLFFDEDERDNQYIHPYFHYIPRCQNYYYYYSVLSFNLIQVDILLLPVCSPPHAKLLLLHQLGPSLLAKKISSTDQIHFSLRIYAYYLPYYAKLRLLLSKTKNHSPPLLLLQYYYCTSNEKTISQDCETSFLHIKVTDSYYGENKLVFYPKKST